MTPRNEPPTKLESAVTTQGRSIEGLGLIQVSLKELPLPEEFCMRLTPDQQIYINGQKSYWQHISLCWGAKMRPGSDPLDDLYEAGKISKWAKTYYQLQADYYWQIWIITLAVWTDIKKRLTSSVETPGQLFYEALQRESMRSVIRIMESYREFSFGKEKKIAKLGSKAISGELLPSEQREFNYLTKRQYTISIPEVENWCLELLNLIFSVAHQKAGKDIRLKGLIDSLDRISKTALDHKEKIPNSDVKGFPRQRSFAVRDGEVIYAAEGGAYRRPA